MVCICIDLKSFYASAECVERQLDPLNVNLVVADESRTDKTICLAVSPSLKAIGVPGRPRLYEVIQIVKRENERRLRSIPFPTFRGKSYYADELSKDPALEIAYVIAPPQMKRYMDVSAHIYDIYLRYISPEDIHVYSIDEVFIDATGYLNTYHCTAHELAMKLVREVLKETGITATAGIGTNMYLAKVAMDIVAKKMPADEDGVRIAELDEYSFRDKLWEHTPLTDFWRIGAGTAKRLESMQIRNMGDLAMYSLTGEKRLFKQFGINAELLIDHAWGYEPCTMEAIKRYQPGAHSISQSQVLSRPYPYEQAKLVCREMIDQLVMDLVRKGLVTDRVNIYISYDKDGVPADYDGELAYNYYGKLVPKSVHGYENLDRQSASSKQITAASMRIFERIVDPDLCVRRICVAAERVIPERYTQEPVMQYSLFDDVEAIEKKQAAESLRLSRESALQKAMLNIRDKFGKNAVLKGMNLSEGATARERNGQVGGHKA